MKACGQYRTAPHESTFSLDQHVVVCGDQSWGCLTRQSNPFLLPICRSPQLAANDAGLSRAQLLPSPKCPPSSQSGDGRRRGGGQKASLKETLAP